MKNSEIFEGRGHSRVKASLARFKLYVSPSNLVSSASRDAESSWLSNIAVSREFFSALEQSNKKALALKKKSFEIQGGEDHKIQ